MPLLEVKSMTHFFGGLRAVHEFNLSVEKGGIYGLIGPNGAGKTTIFNLITGIHSPTEGEIIFQGRPIIGMQPHEIASHGLSRTFQNLRLWRHMSVIEHIKMARYSKLTYGLVGAFFDTPHRRREENEADEIAHTLMDKLAISHLADQIVTNLPYGAQRRVEMARALATEPDLLFLDEPTAGMNPEELVQMMNIFRQIHDEFGMAIFLIEHRLRVVMELCDQVQTLVFGEVIAEGTPEEIKNNPRVIEAYLGEEDIR